MYTYRRLNIQDVNKLRIHEIFQETSTYFIIQKNNIPTILHIETCLDSRFLSVKLTKILSQDL